MPFDNRTEHEADLDDMRAEQAAYNRAKRQYLRRAMAHPHPHDPDYPEPWEDPDYEGDCDDDNEA